MGATKSKIDFSDFLSQSQIDDLGLLTNLINRNQGNIVRLAAYVLHGKLYILIGEVHQTGYSPFVPYLHILSSNCDIPVDIFIEKKIEHMQDYRVRDGVSSIGVYCNVMHRANEITTMNQVQMMAESECSYTMRVHAVDPMPEDAMIYLHKCLEEGICTVEQNREIQNRLLDDLDQLNARIGKGKMLLDHKIAIDAYASFVTGEIIELVTQSQALEEPSTNYLWSGYRKLLDMYAFARMLRSDNNNVCIFYGGGNHVRSISQAFENYTDAIPVPRKYLPHILMEEDDL